MAPPGRGPDRGLPLDWPVVPSLSQAQSNAVAELLRITPAVGELGRLFANAGHELYLVGGSVRDALLGRLGNDLDFTTSARPDESERLLRSFTKSVWDIGKQWGTIGARKRVGDSDWIIEITTFRADAYRTESRKPEVAFGERIDDDLIRRDFTVNAMAISLVDKRFVDPYGGLADLAEGLLRTPFEPERSFSDDPLRMMRAARFTSQLGFTVTPPVREAMRELAERIDIVSAERVRDELTKLLLSDDPRPGLELLVDTGLADRILPELPALRLEIDEHHPDHQHKNVYTHSLTVLEQAIALEKERNHEPDIVLRLAALLHDIGKPATREFLPGAKVSFHHHDVVGAKIARKRLKALRYSRDQVDAVSHLIELHLRFHGYADAEVGKGAAWTDSAVRRYVRDAGDDLERLHILTRSDSTTRNHRRAERLRRAYDELEWRIDELSAQEQLDALRPALDGQQIMAVLGISEGPAVGRAYKFLLAQRIDRGPMTPEEAATLLIDWWEQDGRAAADSPRRAIRDTGGGPTMAE